MSASKNIPQVDAEHHAKAAEHRDTAKYCTSGDAKKAMEHGKQAEENCTKVKNYVKRAAAA